MKLRFIVVSSVNWVHYAHFLCRYSNLNRMCNFLRALNIWLSVSSSPASIFPARSPLFSDPVNRPAATACTCTRVSLFNTPASIFICLVELAIYLAFTHTCARTSWNCSHGFIFWSLPFAELKQEGDYALHSHSSLFSTGHWLSVSPAIVRLADKK